MRAPPLHSSPAGCFGTPAMFTPRVLCWHNRCMFEVKSEAFNGPMAKLLELIEEKQLEITRVNLATVTADFIKYIESLGEAVMPDILSDFIVVASRLLLIKSKVLLPNLELTQDEEGDILDLEHRLRIYREYKI